MTICDLCKEHVMRRSKGAMKMIGFSTETLAKMTLEELHFLYKNVTEGMSVCGDCKKMCIYGDCTVEDKARWKQGKPYSMREIEDQRLVNSIKREWNRRRVLVNRIVSNNLLPKVPKNEPSM